MSEAPQFILAIDQGSHATRALIFDRLGAVRAQAEVAVPTLSSALGYIEHDPEQMVASVLDAAAESLRRAQLDPGAAIAAALATQRSTVVCWDRDSGRALSPAISWQDRRNARWLESLDDRGEWIRRQTGLRLSPHYGASKLRWCLDYLPDVAAAARDGQLACGPLASFLLARITQERSFLSDPANASRTLLWSPHSGDWSDELLDLFGIERTWLPLPVPTAYSHGRLRVEGDGIPITIVSGDQSTVPFAFGPIDPDAIYINIGTGAFIQRQTGTPAAPPLLTSVLYADRGQRMYAMEGTVNGAGAALRWLSETQHIDTVPILETLTDDWLEHGRPPLFRNTVSGLGSPYWRSGPEPGFVGSGDAQSMIAAVLESVAFLINENLLLMREQAPGVRYLLLTGGVARSRYLLQALVNISGLPARRPEQTEATARGAAALALGPERGFAAPSWLEVSPASCTPLEQRYRDWREMMQG